MENKIKIIEGWESVGWSSYTKDKQSLKTALQESTYVLIAVDGSEVVGLSRSLSDKVSIHYLQDILVSPKHQKKGIGRQLLEKALQKFNKVRTHMILTDDEEKQKKFYESLGYKNLNSLEKYKLNAFVKMLGLDLE